MSRLLYSSLDVNTVVPTNNRREIRRRKQGLIAIGKPTKVTNSIRSLRFEHGEMTQADLAKRLGVTRQTINAIERGRYSPSLEMAFQMAGVFNVPLDDVFQYPLQSSNEGGESMGSSGDDQKRGRSATGRLVDEIRKLRDRPDAQGVINEIDKLGDRPDAQRVVDEIEKLRGRPDTKRLVEELDKLKDKRRND